MLLNPDSSDVEEQGSASTGRDVPVPGGAISRGCSARATEDVQHTGKHCSSCARWNR